MKIAVLDCFAGISGDMTLAALIDLGVPKRYLVNELKKLSIKDWEIRISKTQKHHIGATAVEVLFDEKNQPSRKYADIKKLISDSKLNDSIKKKAGQAFKILGEAEARIHHTKLEKIYFHEVGAMDSIIDLIGSIIGFEYLEADKIFSTPVPLGSGFTKTEHGIMPVPSPAAMEILKDYSIVHRNSEFEMTTPTGATILKILSDEILPENFIYKIEKSGYGAGKKDTDNWPNLLRIITGQSESESLHDSMLMVECNIDDMNPEFYEYATDKLFRAGAADVFITQVMMKKNRPGNLLSVLIKPEICDNIEKILFSETTTIGLRKYSVERKTLLRESKKIKCRFGELDVKVIELDGKKIIRPEYEVCKKIAEKNKISLRDVYREIENIDLNNNE